MIKENKYIAFPLTFLLFILAFYVRTQNWQELVDYEDKKVIILNSDAVYHAYLIDEKIENNREIRDKDNRTYFPHGYKHHWPGFYDYSMAFVGKLLHGIGVSKLNTSIIISMFPAFLCSLTCLLFFWQLNLAHPTFLNYYIALFVVLNPYLISVSFFGNLDHHFIEIFLGLSLFVIFCNRNLLNFNFWPYLYGLTCLIGFYSTTSFIIPFIILNFVFVKNNNKFLHLSNFGLAIFILIINLLLSYPLAFNYQSISSFHIFVCIFLGLLNYIKFTKKNIIILMGLLILIGGVFHKTLFYGFVHLLGTPVDLNNKEVNPITWVDINLPIIRSMIILLIIGIGYFIYILSSKKYKLSKIQVRLIALSLFLFVLILLQGRFFRDYNLLFSLSVLLLFTKFFSQRYLLILLIFSSLFSFDIGKIFNYESFYSYAHKSTYQLMKTIKKLDLDVNTIVAPWNLGHELLYYTKHSNITNPFWSWEAPYIQGEVDFAKLNTANNNEQIEKVLDYYKTNYLIIMYSEIDYNFWEQLLEQKFTLEQKYEQLNYQFYKSTPSKNLASGFSVLYQNSFYKLLEYKKQNKVILPKIEDKLVISAKIIKSTGAISSYFQTYYPQNSNQKIIISYDSTALNGLTKVLDHYTVEWDGKIYKMKISDSLFKNGPQKLIDLIDTLDSK